MPNNLGVDGGITLDLTKLQQLYREKTEYSRKFHEESSDYIPGGVQGNIKYFEPYPLAFQHGTGAWLKDVDGNQYVDYLLSYGALILGHGHPVVKEAVQNVWETYGTSSLGAPYLLELEMTKRISTLYPSAEQLRFTNSGLEATLLAIRLGMAYTGKSTIAKFEGHYHGGHDQVLVSVSPSASLSGSSSQPRSVPDSMGLPLHVLENTVVLPFNDADACERILVANKDRIGVVIVEPLQAGYIVADFEFMQRLRMVTKELGMVLVFDEVKTGFRVEVGGAQAHYQVKPDLTAFGKVLGGGFPIGAVGGRRDIMELSSPQRSRHQGEVVFHSGTFNGNPVSLAAGYATIGHLQEPGRYAKLMDSTKALRTEIEAIAFAAGFTIQTIGAGSIFNIVFGDSPIRNFRDLSRVDMDMRRALDFILMGHGVFSKPLNRFSVSLAHDRDVLDFTVTAFEKSFADLKKYLQG